MAGGDGRKRKHNPEVDENGDAKEQLKALETELDNEVIVHGLPTYTCHKKVGALKIKDIKIEKSIDGKITLIFFDKDYQDIEVSQEYMRKHLPIPGGYYVVYADGYQSFSPAKPFESGYNKD